MLAVCIPTDLLATGGSGQRSNLSFRERRKFLGLAGFDWLLFDDVLTLIPQLHLVGCCGSH